MLALIAPTAGCVDIDIAIALAWFLVVHCHRGRVTIVPSLAVELPSRSHHPLPSRRALHHPLFTIASFIAAHRCCALGPSPPRSCRPSPSRSHRAVPRRQGAVVPSIAVSRPSLASHLDGCRAASPHSAAFHLPVPLIVASPFEPLVHLAGCHVSSLLTPPPPICRRLRLSSRHCLLSRNN